MTEAKRPDLDKIGEDVRVSRPWNMKEVLDLISYCRFLEMLVHDLQEESAAYKRGVERGILEGRAAERGLLQELGTRPLTPEELKQLEGRND